MLFDSIPCYMSLLSSLWHAERAFILSLSPWARMVPCPQPALIGNLQIWHKILVQITRACCATTHPLSPSLILSSVIGIEHVEPPGTNSSIWGNCLPSVWPLVCFWMPNEDIHLWTLGQYLEERRHHFVHNNMFVNHAQVLAYLPGNLLWCSEYSGQLTQVQPQFFPKQSPIPCIGTVSSGSK